MAGYFISGDIGGTKTLLQVSELRGGVSKICFQQRYASRNYSDFSLLFTDFLKEAALSADPAAACFAVAGPVSKSGAALTNLPWLMDTAAIETTFSIPKVKIINDFEAVAASIEILLPADLVTLQEGTPHPMERRVVLGAGTGMGGAWLIWQRDRYIPLPSEAGHMDFAPQNTLQVDLLQHLRKKYGHVSVERLLSGPGLTNIFNFLYDRQPAGIQDDAPGIEQIRGKDDAAAQVASLASDHRHPAAITAMELFVDVYGAYAGNLALAGLARNGVYVAGGIAPRIIGKLSEGGFIKSFCNKGRFSPLMKEIPVHVVMNTKAGLLGAAQEAKRMMVQE